MSHWVDFNLEKRILQILQGAECDPQHHFGQPYQTPYQLAIEFNVRWPEIVEQIGLQIGGAGTDERNSLSQYFAQQLSSRIKNREIVNIEGAFLSNEHITEMSFMGNVKSSMIDQPTISMFRIRG